MATCKDCLFKCYTDDVDRVEETCNFFLPKDNYAEVVRCKDCKYCVVMSEGMCCDRALPTKRMEDYYIHGSTVLARVDGDAFCSRGERRTDENND